MGVQTSRLPVNHPTPAGKRYDPFLSSPRSADPPRNEPPSLIGMRRLDGAMAALTTRR